MVGRRTEPHETPTHRMVMVAVEAYETLQSQGPRARRPMDGALFLTISISSSDIISRIRYHCHCHPFVMVLCGLFWLVKVPPSVANPRGGQSVRRTFAHDPSPCECVRLFVVRRVWYNVCPWYRTTAYNYDTIHEFFRCRSIGPNTKSSTTSPQAQAVNPIITNYHCYGQ